MWGSIPQCRDHTLSRRLTLNACATQAPLKDYLHIYTDMGSSRAMVRKEFLRHFMVHKGGFFFFKLGDRTHGQKELHWGHEDWPIIYFHVGRGSGIG